MLFESFFVNKFSCGIRSVREYIDIHRDFFETELNISSDEFEEKILKTLYFKKDTSKEIIEDSNKRRVFSKEEKAKYFAEFFREKSTKEEYWGPTMLDVLKANNKGNIGMSIRKEMVTIKELNDKKDFIKNILIQELGYSQGIVLYDEGIKYFDPLRNKRIGILNKFRSKESLLENDPNLRIVFKNIESRNMIAPVHKLYEEYKYLKELYDLIIPAILPIKIQIIKRLLIQGKLPSEIEFSDLSYSEEIS